MKAEENETKGLIEAKTVLEINKQGERFNNELFLIREKILTIRMNDSRIGSISCTPESLEELVYGWLLTEGFIKQAAEVEAVRIDEKALTACVDLKPAKAGTAQVNRACWTENEIFFLQRRFSEDPPLHDKTRAAHSCMIARKTCGGDPRVLYRSEDAGRHSALDKAIGWAALNKVDLNDCFLMTSGRISTRMAAKAVRSGVSALAGKGTVTAEAVELAEEYGMTLIGYVKENSATWFHE